MQIAYDAGIHYKYSFGLLIGLLSMYLLNTIVLFPKTNISEEPKENSVAGLYDQPIVFTLGYIGIKQTIYDLLQKIQKLKVQRKALRV